MQQVIIGIEPLKTFKEAMGFLRISRSTLLRMIDSGEVNSYKVGTQHRFYLSDLQKCVRPIHATKQGGES